MGHHLRHYGLILLGSLLTISACGPLFSREETTLSDPWGVIEIEPRESIPIGVAATSSEPGIGIEGLDQLRGVQLALQERGNVRGFPLRLVTIDIGCSESGGKLAAVSLIRSPSLVAIVGPTCSSACLASGPIYDNAHFTVVSPSCGTPDLTEPGPRPKAFLRTMYDDTIEGSVSAEFAFLELAARKVAIIHDGSPETSYFAQAFEARFVSLGGKIVATQIIERDADNLQATLRVIRGVEPDLVYAPLLPNSAVTLTEQMIQVLPNTLLMGGQHYQNAWYLAEAGAAAEGVYASGPLLKGDYQELSEAYLRRFEEAPSSPQYALAYDATNLILDAIERASTINKAGVLQIGRQALREALYATSLYPGLSGTLTCTAWGDCSAGSVAVSRVENGAWVVIYIP